MCTRLPYKLHHQGQLRPLLHLLSLYAMVLVADVKEEEESNDESEETSGAGDSSRRKTTTYPKIVRPSKLREDDLTASMRRAGVPAGFYKLPDSPESLPPAAAPPGWMSVSVVAFDAGFHLPLHPSVAEVLRRWDVSPGQLTPNAWRALVGFCILCHERRVEFSVNLFAHWARAAGDGYVKVFRRDYKKKLLMGMMCRDYGWEARWFLLKLPLAMASVDARWRPFRPVSVEPLSPEEEKGWDWLVGGGGNRSSAVPVRMAKDVVRSPAFLEWLRAGFGGVLPPEHCWYRDAVNVSGNNIPLRPLRFGGRAASKLSSGGRSTKRTRVVESSSSSSGEEASDDDDDEDQLVMDADALIGHASKGIACGRELLADVKTAAGKLAAVEAAMKGAAESFKRRLKVEREAREKAVEEYRAKLEAEREVSAGLRRNLDDAGAGDDDRRRMEKVEVELRAKLVAVEDRCEELEARAAGAIKRLVAGDGVRRTGSTGSRARRGGGGEEDCDGGRPAWGFFV